MRIVFAGSPPVATASLSALLSSEIGVSGVISQPDRPVGRKRVLTATSVSAFAAAHDLPLATPGPQDALAAAIAPFSPDLAIAVAYGRLIDRAALAVPPLGWWNVHFSLLPKWRGAAPVQRALMAGEAETGVTIFQMDPGLDTGAILASQTHPISPDVTAGELLDELAGVGAQLLVQTLHRLAAGELAPKAQQGEASNAPKLSREEGRLRFAQPLERVFSCYRGCTPEPGAWAMVRDSSHTLTVVKARRGEAASSMSAGEVAFRNGDVHVGCGTGSLVLEMVKASGGRLMSAEQWWRGAGRGVHFDP